MHNLIIEKLCKHGYNSYLVGGAVRDLFLGKEPEDYDVVTEALSNQITKIFENYKVSLVGESFKVCIINGIEVSEYRKDTYFGLSNKNCKIERAKTLHEDLARRDFTINSMAFCSYSGEVIDPYNGINDLNNKIIKFVGDPYQRIYEDPCRIIRACRFLAKINGNFDNSTFEALKKYSYLIKEYVKPERIKLEIFKMMKVKNASLFFIYLNKIDTLKFIFPSLTKCFIDGGKYHNETIFDHCMIVGDSIAQRCPLTKLAGYLHDVGKPTSIGEDGSFIGHEKIGRDIVYEELYNLRFSTKEILHISSLIRLHMNNVLKIGNKGTRKLLSKLNGKNLKYSDLLRLKVSDRIGNLKKENYNLSEIKEMLNKFENQLFIEKSIFSIKDIDINGYDIMTIFKINSGPRVGNILRFLYEIILIFPSLNKKEKLVQFLLNLKLVRNI